MVEIDVAELPLDSSSFSTMWDFGDPAHSEQRFEAFAARAEGELAACSRTQQARAIGLQRRFDEALEVLGSIEEGNPEPGDELRIRMNLERGRVINSSGSPKDSVAHFERAWTIARENGLDGLAVDAAHMLGIVVEGDEGMKWNERALELAVSSNQPDANKWQGSLFNNMGWSYHESGNFERALELFEWALKLRIGEGKKENIRVAKWCIGRCLRSLERLDEALAIQRELAQDPAADGYVYEEIGECLLAQGNQNEAKPYCARAYKNLSKDAWLIGNESDRLNRLKELGSD